MRARAAGTSDGGLSISTLTTTVEDDSDVAGAAHREEVPFVQLPSGFLLADTIVHRLLATAALDAAECASHQKREPLSVPRQLHHLLKYHM